MNLSFNDLNGKVCVITGGNSPKATTKLEALSGNDSDNLEDSFFGIDTNGFFLTNQNRFLLTDEKTGELTERGHKIYHRSNYTRRWRI